MFLFNGVSLRNSLLLLVALVLLCDLFVRYFERNSDPEGSATVAPPWSQAQTAEREFSGHVIQTGNAKGRDNNTWLNDEMLAANGKRRIKTILYWNSLFGKPDFGLGFGRSVFEKAHCSFSACTTTNDRAKFDKADMVMFHGFQIRAADMPARTRHDQIWVYYNRENPLRSKESVRGMNDKFNFTVTYLDSPDTDVRYSVVRVPKSNPYKLPDVATIGAKSRMVVWIVSDCSVHSTRVEYVQELSRHVQVDVYGACGNLSCPRHPRSASSKCYKKIEETYFFYLALENGFCKDYITEKPVIATRLNIVPIVLGYVNYSQILPPNSFIDVRDFKSPRHLAEYISYLGKNIKEYMNYLQWKAHFPYILRIKGDKNLLICRLCEVLHNRDFKYKSRFDLEDYWNSGKVCLVGDKERESVHLTKLRVR